MPRKIEISSVYARLALQSGIVPASELLRGVSFTAGQLGEIDFLDASDLVILFRNYNQCAADRGWTARLGSQFSMAAHGPLGFAALSAPTLGEALEVMAALNASRTTAVDAQLIATDTHLAVRVTDVTGERDFAIWVVEVVIKVLESLISTILGHPVGRNVIVNFAHPSPEGVSQLIEAYDAKVVFDAPDNSIAVPLPWRHLPSPLHDESVFRANVIRCRELIAAREQSESFALAVSSQLSNHFDSQLLHTGQSAPPPTMEQLAEAMHLTSRTLIRKLQRENTTYRELLEQLRRQHAQQLLTDARRNVADVAEILGYREAANFTRAFKRWHGVSPAAWRRR